MAVSKHSSMVPLDFSWKIFVFILNEVGWDLAIFWLDEPPSVHLLKPFPSVDCIATSYIAYSNNSPDPFIVVF